MFVSVCLCGCWSVSPPCIHFQHSGQLRNVLILQLNTTLKYVSENIRGMN